jgi:SAM-dependent methyltransferase
MSRFKVGQTVYSGRGDKMQTLVVAKVHKNPLLPVRQYTFEAPNDGWACGEQSLRATPDGEDLRLRDCFVDDHEEQVPTIINTIASAKRNPIFMDRTSEFGDVSNLFSDSDIFFRPDINFVKWLIAHANGRMIMDIGCGQGHLVNMIKRFGGRAMGIEPNIDHAEWVKWRLQHDGDNIDVNEVMSYRIEDSFTRRLIESLGKDQVILVFARPCHSDFVEVGIRNMPIGMEALYITLPENIHEYNDLGRFKKEAVELTHDGSSEEDEVVYSIIRK